MILGKNLYSRKRRLLNLFKIIGSIVPYFWKLSFGRQVELLTTSRSPIGSPVLTLKEDGSLRCTSCLLCQNICPSHCISIELKSIEGEEQAPQSFDINILKCIFCGLCEEVCPVDALRMTGKMPAASDSEQNWIWDKEYLSTYSGELISTVGEKRPLLPN